MGQTNELEEMKRQLELLKEKLDRQTIISDKLLRGRLRSVSRTINRSAHASLLVAVTMTPATYYIFHEMRLPVPLWITLVVIMLGGTCVDYILRRDIRNIQHHDLATAGRKLAQFRAKRLRYEKASVAVVLAFFALFVYELLLRWQLSRLINGFIVIGITLIISVTLSLRFHKQTSELQKQIEDATEE